MQTKFAFRSIHPNVEGRKGETKGTGKEEEIEGRTQSEEQASREQK
jgi:hypothetical protein